MATAEIDLGNGRVAEVEIPQGEDPGTYVAHAAQLLKAQSATPASGSLSAQLRSEGEQDTASNIGRELLRPFKSTGNEIVQGFNQAFRPTYDQPNMFDRGVGAITGGLVSPEMSQKAISTPVSQITGLLRMLFPVVGAVANEADVGVNRAARFAGAPDQVADVAGKTAGLGAGFAAPTTGPISLVQQLGQMLTRGGMAPIRAAEATNATNAGLNVGVDARNAAQQSDFLDALSRETAAAQDTAQVNRTANMRNAAAREAALRDVSTAEGRVAQMQGPNVMSPAAARLRNPLTNEQAYGFMNEPTTVMPTIPLTHLEGAADNILAKLKGTPKALQPTKAKNVAEQLTTPDAVGEAFGDMTPQQQRAWSAIKDQLQQSKQSGGLALDKVDEIANGLGQLTHSPDPRTSGLAKKMYKEMFNDIREAAKTDPVAAQYVAANRIARQNLAARDIADIVTFNGTKIDKLGRLTVDPGAILKAVQKNELLADLPPEQAREFVDTLDAVFRARSRVPAEQSVLPEIVPATKVRKPPTMEKSLPTNGEPSAPGGHVPYHSPKRLAMGLAGASAFHAMGLPAYSGGLVGYAMAANYPRLIFTAARTRAGRQMLETLYKDMPPRVGDTAKFFALSNFLKSQPVEVQ